MIELRMLATAAIGNGTRRPGDILCTLETDNVADLVAEIKSRRTIKGLETGTVTLVNGAIETEIINALSNNNISTIGPPVQADAAQRDTAGPSIDPSLTNATLVPPVTPKTPKPDYKDTVIADVEAFTPELKALLAGSNLRTFGDVEQFLTENQSLTAINGIDETLEGQILNLIFTAS